MEFTSGDYLELFNPINNNYFPVRILESVETGIKVKILGTGEEKNIGNYYLNNYDHRIPNTSSELLENCGFINENRSLIWKRNNIMVVECFQGKIEKKNEESFFVDFSSRFLGYKITTQNNLDEFLTVLNQTPYDFDKEEFSKKYSTVSRAIKLFKELSKHGLNQLDTDNIILKCSKN